MHIFHVHFMCMLIQYIVLLQMQPVLLNMLAWDSLQNKLFCTIFNSWDVLRVSSSYMSLSLKLLSRPKK